VIPTDVPATVTLTSVGITPAGATTCTRIVSLLPCGSVPVIVTSPSVAEATSITLRDGASKRASTPLLDALRAIEDAP
jgi:hypothetical protein